MRSIYSGFGERFPTLIHRQRDTKLAQPNFQYEKRQKELAKKKKQEEKKQRKLEEKKSADMPSELPDNSGTAA
jgi:hypothetical protein